MGKKKDRLNPAKHPAAEPARPALKLEGISRRGWKVIGAGIGIVIIGYYVLSLTDPAGQNWASTLSPFLLLGGYATIGVGIVTRDPQTDNTNPEIK